MLTLKSREVPTTSSALASAISAALAQYINLDSRQKTVRIEGDYPNLDLLEIDVSNAAIDLAAAPPPRNSDANAHDDGPTAAEFRIAAHPVRVENASIDLDINGNDVAFGIDHDDDGRAMLVLASARDGQLQVRTTQRDLEQLVLEIARRAAAKHGITITDVALDIAMKDAKTLHMKAAVTVRKLVKATINLSGAVALNNDLIAKLSNLRCEGEGMIGSMACGFIQPQLAKVNNRAFPLSAFALGNVHARDLQIHIQGGEIRIQAAFGE